MQLIEHDAIRCSHPERPLWNSISGEKPLTAGRPSRFLGSLEVKKCLMVR